MTNKDQELLREMYSDIKHIKKVLEGNGSVGLISKVENNCIQLNSIKTIGRIIVLATGSGWAITIAMLIVNHGV